MAEVATSEPTEAIAGDTWRWDRTFADFSAADGYALSYALRGPVDLDIEGAMVTAVGDGWQVRVPAASTAPLTAGTYRLVGYVTKAGERDTVYQDSVVVAADPATAVGEGLHDEKVLALLDAVIEGRATTDREEEQINSRGYRLMSFEELIRIQGTYRRRVMQIRDPEGEHQDIGIEFSAPC